MNKIKEFSRSFIFLSVLYMAVGLVLLLVPAMSLRLIGNGFAVLLIVIGVTYGVLFFTGDKKTEGYLQMDLVIGIICVAFGIFVLLTPGFLEMILPLAVSVLLLIGAIVKIQNAFSMRRLMIRHWYLLLICAIVIIVLGVLLLFDPFKMSDRQKIVYIGICLMLDGLTNLLSLICIRIRSNRIKKIQEKDPDTDVTAMYKSEWEKADSEKAEKKAEKKAKKEQEKLIVDAKATDIKEPEPEKPEATKPDEPEPEKPEATKPDEPEPEKPEAAEPDEPEPEKPEGAEPDKSGPEEPEQDEPKT